MDKKKVLLIDDDQAVLLAYRKLFKRYGIEMDTAETVTEAKELLARNDYPVVITDLSLTGMVGEEGFEVACHVKEFCPKTKMILITAHGSHSLIKKAYDLGVSYYFEKPVSITTLRDALVNLGVV